MRRIPLLVTVALIAIACAPAGDSTSTTTSTSTTLAPTTTSTAAPTTTIPVATTAAFEDPQEVDLLFDVTGIEEGSIAGYAGAGTNHEQTATLFAGTPAVEATGRLDESIDGTVWREVWTGGGSSAWVDDAFLSLNETATVTFVSNPCSTFGTPSGEIARAGPSESTADHIAQIWQISRPECTRVVIALGADFDFDSAAPLATTVPPDVSVEAFGTWVRVSMPGIQLSRGDAGEDLGDVTVIVSRTVERVLVVDVHAGAPGEYFAQFLTDPARIVIDLLSANAAAVVVAPPVVGDSVILAEGLPPSVEMPLLVSGYSRWFEATGVVVVRRLDQEQGVGDIVEAVVKGDSVIAPGAGTVWGVYTTDWLDAWGLFTFELDGLAVGSYELFIGECRTLEGGDTCEDVGVYLPLTVAG